MRPIIEEPSLSDPRSAIDAAGAALAQCAAFARGLTPAEYREPCAILSGSTIGQHVRHTLDHYAAILAPRRAGVIDYDHRDRDTPVEHDPRAAGALIDELLALLERTLDADEPVRVRVMIAADGRESLLASSIGRELAFAAHHAVHHHAMIAAIARTMGMSVPDGFGVAPSTAHHRAHAG